MAEDTETQILEETEDRMSLSSPRTTSLTSAADSRLARS